MQLHFLEMNIYIIFAYILIFGGIVLWAFLLPRGKKVPNSIVENTTVFGGAFLLASCFINLAPHMYINGFSTPVNHIKIGAAVMLGFIIQLLLEHLTNGVEHGHNHCHNCETENEEPRTTNESHFHPMTGLIIGLSIHAFLEGMPLVDSDGDIHQGLLYGIVLHNIPIALVLTGLFMHNGYSIMKSIALLSVFAIMTPLGSLCNIYLVTSNTTIQSLIMGVVVGILLHVSVSILFDKGQNSLNWLKLAIIIMAFVAAYFTPGCPEIYPF